MTTNAILVTGTTGNVGGEVVQALVRSGHQVRALVRDLSRPVPQGAVAVTGDLNEPASMAGALDGVSAAFLLPGYQDMPGLLAEVRRAGVERVVLLLSILWEMLSADGDKEIVPDIAEDEAQPTAVSGGGFPVPPMDLPHYHGVTKDTASTTPRKEVTSGTH